MIKKKQGRRILAMLLCVLLTLPMLSVYAAAEDGVYLDTVNHWCREPIRYWTQHKVVMGCGNDLFRPDEPITRRMAAVIVCRFLGFDMATPEEDPFPDVSARSDYAGAIADCKEAGIVQGNNFGNYAPDEGMTRNAAMLMLARVYRMEPREDLSALNVFEDPETAAIWSRGEIAALVEADIVHGWAGKLRATDICTRAEFVEMLRAMVSDYISTPGIYDLARIDSNKPLFIATDGVTVIGSTDAPIVINRKVNGGTLDLNGSTVDGDIYVRGEDNTIINGKPGTVIRTGPDAGTTTVNGVEVPPDTVYVIPGGGSGGIGGGGGSSGGDPSTPDEELTLNWKDATEGTPFKFTEDGKKMLPGDSKTIEYNLKYKTPAAGYLYFKVDAGDSLLAQQLKCTVTISIDGTNINNVTCYTTALKDYEIQCPVEGTGGAEKTATFTVTVSLPTDRVLEYVNESLDNQSLNATFTWGLVKP